MHFSTLAITFLAVGAATALPGRGSRKGQKQNQSQSGGPFDGLYSFNKRAFWDFSTLTSIPSDLHVSDYPVNGQYAFSPSNVAIKDGYLQLKVPGGQSMPYKGGEITTVAPILYASVETVGILTETPGVCNGMFFYQSDNQETDIEWLSDPASNSNVDQAKASRQAANTRYLFLSNQATSRRTQKTMNTVAPPSNPTSTEHRYRLDWFPGMTRFFIDGVQVWNSTKNVPSVAGSWVFNNWADGSKDWSAGPPAQDAIFKIRSIEMYYNV